MSTEKVRHICWIKGAYLITKRGRKWLYGENRTPGQKAYKDKIAINEISQHWQVNENVDIFAVHQDDITPYGHNVVLIPISEQDYYAAPEESRF